MLQKLSITNYAIIQELEVAFGNQLNIITGETGAGKSILVGALGLILGQRADSGLLLNADKKCVVEAVFAIKLGMKHKAFFIEHDLDEDDHITVRREITSNGKSRAFINDTPVNLTQLKQLGYLMIDLHQQFDTLELGQNEFQIDVLDAIADNQALVQEFKNHYQSYQKISKHLQQLQAQQEAANATQDYNQFLLDELLQARLQPNELETADQDLKRLSNAEQIKVQLSAAYFQLSQSEEPIVQQLKVISNKVAGLQSMLPELDVLQHRILAAQVELADIASELEAIDSKIEYDEERIQSLNDKVAQGYKLLKKHQVNTTQELLTIQTQLEESLQSVLNIEEEIKQTQVAQTCILADCHKTANTISANRKKAAAPFAKKVNELLVQVGMPNAMLQVSIENCDLNAHGADTIRFMFDGNKSGKFESVEKVASGGELSRLMLCIKSIVAKKLSLPTLIFDEIDTGISGEAAKQVGNIMQELCQGIQVIAITHQPQIAAKANTHFYIYKQEINKQIATQIKQLNTEERITSIAKMLAGDKPSQAALASAKEMME